VDDILDFSGDQTAVGKPLGSDLLQGLVTLPAIYYAEANPDDSDVILLTEGGWGNQDRMERLVNSIRNSDAIQKSMQEAEGFIKRALGKLSSLHPGIERSALEDLAKYIIDRRV
jgi:geranylgeranyl pyrophosphate synthase